MSSTHLDIEEKSSTDECEVSLHACLLQHKLQLTPDGHHVRWESTNPEHPRNWSTSRKIFDITVIVLMDLVVTATSTAGTAAADAAHSDYGIDRTLAIFLFVSVSLFGQLVGSLVFSPYSETFGRKKLYIGSGLLFAVGCVVIASVHSLVAVVIGRAVTGSLSSIPANILGGSIEDMCATRPRVWLICIWCVASSLGLTLGPIMSVYITENLNWRWVFYVYAMIVGVITALMCFIRESRPSLLLARQVAQLRQEKSIKTPPPLNPDHVPDFRTFVQVILIRPVQLFGEPIVVVISVMAGSVFGLVYLFTDALKPIYLSLGFTTEQASLPFLAIALGSVVSLFTRFIDQHIVDTRLRSGLPALPENKLAGICIGTPLLSIGLWWFAWTIPPYAKDTHWIVPTIPLVLIGYAVNEFPTVCLAYLSDSYLSFSASAFASATCVRAVFCAVFPLFSEAMFSGLGPNVAASVLAAFATVFCIVPPLFLRYGTRIRARSQFARFSLDTYKENCIHENEFIQSPA